MAAKRSNCFCDLLPDDATCKGCGAVKECIVGTKLTSKGKAWEDLSAEERLDVEKKIKDAMEAPAGRNRERSATTEEPAAAAPASDAGIDSDIDAELAAIGGLDDGTAEETKKEETSAPPAKEKKKRGPKPKEKKIEKKEAEPVSEPPLDTVLEEAANKKIEDAEPVDIKETKGLMGNALHEKISIIFNPFVQELLIDPIVAKSQITVCDNSIKILISNDLLEENINSGIREYATISDDEIINIETSSGDMIIDKDNIKEGQRFLIKALNEIIDVLNHEDIPEKKRKAAPAESSGKKRGPKKGAKRGPKKGKKRGRKKKA